MDAYKRLEKFQNGRSFKDFLDQCRGMAKDMNDGKYPDGCDSDCERMNILIDIAEDWNKKRCL